MAAPGHELACRFVFVTFTSSHTIGAHGGSIQETPSPFSNPEFRESITNAAVRLGKHANYRSAGTIEFLVDNDTGNFYFLEVSTCTCLLSFDRKLSDSLQQCTDVLSDACFLFFICVHYFIWQSASPAEAWKIMKYRISCRLQGAANASDACTVQISVMIRPRAVEL
jgi:hypothetical protein